MKDLFKLELTDIYANLNRFAIEERKRGVALAIDELEKIEAKKNSQPINADKAEHHYGYRKGFNKAIEFLRNYQTKINHGQ